MPLCNVSIFKTGMPGRRKKSCVGRRHKNYEKKLQQQHVNSIGRPKKKSSLNPKTRPSNSTCATASDNSLPLASTSNSSSSPVIITSSYDISTSTDPTSRQHAGRATGLNNLPSPWLSMPVSNGDAINIYKTELVHGCMKVSISVLIKNDNSWRLFVHEREATSALQILSNIPSMLTTSADVLSLLNILSEANVCPGHPDSHFVDFIKSQKGMKLNSSSNNILAELDTFGCKDGETVRPIGCELLVKSGKCSVCVKKRKSIQQQFARWSKRKKMTPTRHTKSSSHTNVRYLNTPLRRERLKEIKKRLISAESRVSRLNHRIATAIQNNGVTVSNEMHSDLNSLCSEITPIVEEKYGRDSFHFLFWQQQLQAAKLKDHRQMK